MPKILESTLEDAEKIIRFQYNRIEQIKEIVEKQGKEITLLELEGEFYFYSVLTLTTSGDRQKLVRIFRILRSFGYTCTSHRPQKDSTSWSGFFRKPDHLSIHINFSSSVCQMVQVGTEMKEVPVYRVRCGDAELSEVDEEALKTEPAEPVEDDIPF